MTAEIGEKTWIDMAVEPGQRWKVKVRNRRWTGKWSAGVESCCRCVFFFSTILAPLLIVLLTMSNWTLEEVLNHIHTRHVLLFFFCLYGYAIVAPFLSTRSSCCTIILFCVAISNTDTGLSFSRQIPKSLLAFSRRKMMIQV